MMYLSSQNTDRYMSNSMSSVLIFCFHISMQLEYKRSENLRGSEYYMKKQTFIIY